MRIAYRSYTLLLVSILLVTGNSAFGQQAPGDVQYKRVDADPEKEIMRRALEHYANEYNWPYVVESPEGYAVFGMEAMDDGMAATYTSPESFSQLESNLETLHTRYTILQLHVLVIVFRSRRFAIKCDVAGTSWARECSCTV